MESIARHIDNLQRTRGYRPRSDAILEKARVLGKWTARETLKECINKDGKLDKEELKDRMNLLCDVHRETMIELQKRLNRVF